MVRVCSALIFLALTLSSILFVSISLSIAHLIVDDRIEVHVLPPKRELIVTCSRLRFHPIHGPEGFQLLGAPRELECLNSLNVSVCVRKGEKPDEFIIHIVN